MTDVTGSFGFIHDCNHTIRNNVCALSVGYFKVGDNRSGQTGNRTYSWSLGGGYYLTTYGSSHLTMPDAKSVAIARVPTLAKEQISVLNSIYELKDIAASLRRISEHLAWAAFRASAGKAVAREFLSGLAKATTDPVTMVKYLVGFDLAWKFGWKPFLADIQTVLSALANLESKHQALLQGWYPCVGSHEDTKTETQTVFSNAQFGSIPTLRGTLGVTRDTKMRTTAGVMRKLSPYAIAHPDNTKLRMLQEQLGLHLTSNVVWEAVPFSFVVDWVLPIQTFLEQFNGSPVPADYVISGQKWITRKSVTDCKLVLAMQPSLQSYEYMIDPGVNRVMTWQGKYSTYVRSTTEAWTLPGLYLPDLKLPKLGQLWTGLELLVQRFRTIAR